MNRIVRYAVGTLAGLSLLGAQAAAGQFLKKSAEDTETAVVGLIKLSGQLQERPGPFDWLMSDAAPTVRAVAEAIRSAGEDDSFRAIVLQLEDAALSTTQIEELGESIRVAREAGREVVVVGEDFSTGELMLGAYADRIIAQSGAGLMLPGMYMEEWYLRDMLEWIGVEPSFVQVGDYKGADEALTRSEPSDAWDENITQLLDSLYGNLRSVITEGRGMTDDQLDTAMEQAWLASVDEGVGLGLIDEAVSLNHLAEGLEDDFGAEVSWRSELVESEGGLDLDPSNPFAIFSLLSRDPQTKPTRPTIAVVHIDGPIVDGESTEGGLFGSSSVGSRTIRRIADELREDDLVRGVVIRINSPGGSATASEVIWQSFRQVAEDKPVFVSVGSMAASGGYYIAVAGDRIFVNPSSIVGSIGVVGGKLAMDGLYGKLRVNVVSRARGPMADMFGPEAWTSAQREQVRDRMQAVYDLFTSRVTAGRKGIDLAETAEGRLFTGDKAVALRMADEVGSLSAAIDALAEEVGIDSFDVLNYPGPQSLESLFSQFSSAVTAPSLRLPVGAASLEPMLQGLVGSAWPAVRSRVDAAIMLRDEPVTLLEHRVLHIR
ncbi:MAG: S49 family peptidase [Phycisphaerales bacterium]